MKSISAGTQAKYALFYSYFDVHPFLGFKLENEVKKVFFSLLVAVSSGFVFAQSDDSMEIDQYDNGTVVINCAQPRVNF